MIYVPPIFKPVINTVYPPNNIIEFERWLGENFKGCATDREYLDVYFTGHYVNNQYGQNHEALQRLTVFLNDLPREKKYWTCVQYDDGILNNVSHLDLFQFNMSKKIGVEMPLLCQPHPYKFNTEKKYFANFIGKKTHPIRKYAEQLKYKDGYYISFEDHSIEDYCRVIHESLFTLCFRGYGLNSFRISEAMQYESIPVYISDEFISAFGCSLYPYGVMINNSCADEIDSILNGVDNDSIIYKQKMLPEYYNKYYTYEGALSQIILSLENEYNLRKQNGAIANINKRIEVARGI